MTRYYIDQIDHTALEEALRDYETAENLYDRRAAADDVLYSLGKNNAKDATAMIRYLLDQEIKLLDQEIKQISTPAPPTTDELEAIRARHEERMRFSTQPPPQIAADFATLLRAVDRLSAELAEAKEALSPFARFLDVRENMRGLTGTADDADSSPIFECSSSVNGTATLTAGDFRRARATLTKDTQ